MAHIRNRFDIQNDIEEERYTTNKHLPNFFMADDEMAHWKSFLLSVLIHGIFFSSVLIFHVYIFSKLPKPLPPTRDIEFKLVQAEEKPPINKNTKIRSDRNTQAGGKHDPKRAISEPGKPAKNKKSAPKAAQNTPAKTPSKAPAPQPQKQVKQQTPAKQVKQQTVTQAPAIKKPTPVSAPSAAKPAFKPTAQSGSTPSAPKIATAPKSPFTVPAPKSNAPVGSTYRPQGTSSGSSSGGSSSGGGTPSPKFSTSGGSGSSGSSGGSSGGSKGGTGGGARGGTGGGAGSGNNPGPGNPNGAPGVDSIRQPNWGPYMRDLEQRIKRNWFPPKADRSNELL